MKLTRPQELILIQIGLNSVLNGLTSKPKNPRPKSRKKGKRQWSNAQRKKFARTMAQVWKDKKANNG